MEMSGLSNLTQYTQSLAGASSAENLKAKISASDNKDTEDAKLMEVCKEFESYFLEQVYKGMLDTVPTTELSSSANNTLLDYYKDEFVKEVASNTTSQGEGLGLAQQLYEQMKRNNVVPNVD